MSTHARKLLTLLICLLSLASNGPSAHSPDTAQPSNARRIRFDVATFEEHDGRRDLISETTIEGPPGTDFNIKLRGGRFHMDARFLTDLVAPDSLKIRANLNTRRLYGYSERNLPLYEEDAQRETLPLGFDEKLVLLPFGRSDNSDQLKIEITPSVSELSASVDSGKPRPLEIKILKASPGGAISVAASKGPHKFTVEAALLEDGREVARSTSNALLQEATDLVFKPTEQASADVIGHPLVVTFNVTEHQKSRPMDQIAFEFDAYQLDGQGATQRQPLGLHGAGINEVGSYLDYHLSDYLRPSGRKYQLRLRIRLAPGEAAN
jgi:hypothetical protein